MDWVKSFVATVRDSVATPVNNPGVAETPGRWTSLRTPSSVSKLKQLYKIFSETKSDQERTAQLFKTVSVFVQLYRQTLQLQDEVRYAILTETFGDVHEFAFSVSRQFVKQLKGAIKQGNYAEQNATALLKTLAASGMMDALETLDIITGPGSVISLASNAVPSTIVTVIQTFASLDPHTLNNLFQANKLNEGLLIERLPNLLYACAKHDHRSVIDELLYSETFSLLCQLVVMHSPLLQGPDFRERLSKCLLAMMPDEVVDQRVIEHLAAKEFISYLLSCLSSFAGYDSLGAIVTVGRLGITFLQKSCVVSDVLEQEFVIGQGYDILSKILMHFDTSKEVSATALDQLLALVTDLIYIGSMPIEAPAVHSPFMMKGELLLKLPEPEAVPDASTCVRNVEAFRVLQNFFRQSTHEHMRLRILDAILSVLAANPRNWQLLQPLQTLTLFISEMDTMSTVLQEALLRLLVFVSTVHSYVPFKELTSLSSLLQNDLPAATLALLSDTVGKFIAFDSTNYRNIFRDTGLLDMVLICLGGTHQVGKGAPQKVAYAIFSADDAETVAKLAALTDIAAQLIKDCPDNALILRQSGCIKSMLALARDEKKRKSALKLFCVLVDQDKSQVHSDLAGLIELMQTSAKTDLTLKRDLLDTICWLFATNPATKDTFRNVGGFVCLISVLVALEGSFVESQETIAKLGLVDALFKTMTMALMSHSVNKAFFRHEIGYSSLTSGIKLMGILPTQYAVNVLEYIMKMAVENVSDQTYWDPTNPKKMVIRNGYAVLLFLEILAQTNHELQHEMMNRLNYMAKLGLKTQHTLSRVGVAGFLMKKYEDILRDPTHTLQPLLLRFVMTVGCYRMLPHEWRLFLRFFIRNDPKDDLDSVRKALLHMVKHSYAPPFLEFNTGLIGGEYACMVVPSVGDQPWPGTHTLMMWICIDNYGHITQQQQQHIRRNSQDNSSSTAPILDESQSGADVHLFHINFRDEHDPTLGIKAFIKDKVFHLALQPNPPVAFPSFVFGEQRWYHIAIVQAKKRFQASEARFYVNGNLVETVKVPSHNTQSSNAYLCLGTSREMSIGRCEQVWRMSGLYLVEGEISAHMIATAYLLGPGYSGNFQLSPFTQYQTYEMINHNNLLLARKLDPSAPLGILDLSKSASWFTLPEDRVLLSFHAKNFHRMTAGDENTGRRAGTLVLNSARVNGRSNGFLMGGAAAFYPCTLSTGIQAVGGMKMALLLVQLAKSAEELWYMVSVLVALIKHNHSNTAEMEEVGGYHILSYILHSKPFPREERLMEAILDLVGMSGSDRTNTVISNIKAFKHLLCDLSLWDFTAPEGQTSDGDLPAGLQMQRAVIQHIHRLISYKNSQQRYNLWRLRELNFILMLLDILSDPSTHPRLLFDITQLLASILRHDAQSADLVLIMNHLLASTDSTLLPDERTVIVRNLLLEMLLHLILETSSITSYIAVIDTDWLLGFINCNLHPSSLVLALKIICSFSQCSSEFHLKFKAAQGMRLVERALEEHSYCVDVYFLLFSWLLGKPVMDLPLHPRLDYVGLFSTFTSPQQKIACADAASIILSTLKRNIELGVKFDGTLPSFESASDPTMAELHHYLAVDYVEGYEFQLVLLEFLMHLYDCCQAFQESCVSPIFVRLLVELLFPDERLNTRALGKSKEKKAATYEALVFSFLLRMVEKTAKTTNKIHLIFSLILESAPVTAEAELLVYHNHILSETLRLFHKISTAQEIFENSRFAANLPIFCDYIVDKVYQHIYPYGAQKVSKFIARQVKNLLIEEDVDSGNNKIRKAVLPELFRSLNRITLYLVGSCSPNKLPTQSPSPTSSLSSSSSTLPFVNFELGTFGSLANFTSTSYVPLSSSPSSSPNKSHGIALPSQSASAADTLLGDIGEPSQPLLKEEEVLQILHKIINRQRIHFAPENNDKEYLSCLCYQLVPFLLHDNQQIREATMNLFKLFMITKPEFMHDLLCTNKLQGEVIDLETNAFDTLLQKDFNSFSFWVGDSIELIQKVFEAACYKIWTQRQQAEANSKGEQIKQQRARKSTLLQKLEKSTIAESRQMAQIQEVSTAMRSLFIETERTRSRLKALETHDRHQRMLKQWQIICSELSEERGPAGPDEPSVFAKFKLDETEGPYRMRKKLKRNLEFYNHYPCTEPAPDEKLQDPKVPTSEDTKDYLQQKNEFPDIEPLVPLSSSSRGSPRISPQKYSKRARSRSSSRREELSDDGSNRSPYASPARSPALSRATPESPVPIASFEETKQEASTAPAEIQEIDDDLLSEDDFTIIDSQSSDNHRIRKLIGPKDDIAHVYNCSRIVGMELCRCLLLICKKTLYVIDHYCISSQGQMTAVTSTDTERSLGAPYMPIPVDTYPDPIKWPYSEVTEVLRRRYLLRPAAIEIFLSNGTSLFLVLDIKERERVYKNLCINTGRHGETGEQLSGAKNTENEEEKWIPFGDTFWRKTTVLARWQQGEISNFQYLMYLNTLAGRSYSDLSQYPCFPWVLSDYTSQVLDLSNPKVYRDLSSPMGALSAQRAAKFRERYENWDAAEEGVPKWHYGTHYSSAGIVGLFLIRLEPFTQHFVKLQSGKFDIPDRLFHSIEEAWRSASGQGDNYSLTDVRELTPEFYYLPEFLENKNRFVFGEKHTGEKIGDIILPPWAKGDPRKFVSILRQALESEYVSAHLHEWIDLVFGYKQQGEPAVDALNIFYYLTYEGAVDLDSIKDTLEREAILSQINNYGQTPTQLFTKPHPKRKQLSPPPPPDPSSWSPICIVESGPAIGNMHPGNKKVSLCPTKQVFLPTKYKKFVGWGFRDRSLRLADPSDDKLVTVWEDIHPWGQIKKVCATEDGKFLITGGSDCMITVFKVLKEGGQYHLERAKRLYGHSGGISCLTSSRVYNAMLSGSEDRTCILWDLDKLGYVRTLGPLDAEVSAIAIHDGTGDIVTCAGSHIRLWDINGNPIAPPSLPASTPRPSVMAERITAVIISHVPGLEWHPSYTMYITGHQDGSVQLWRLDQDLKELVVIRKLSMHSARITCLAVPVGEKGLYSGDARGRVIFWTDNTDADDSPLSARKSSRLKQIASRRPSISEVSQEVRGKINKLMKTT